MQSPSRLRDPKREPPSLGHQPTEQVQSRGRVAPHDVRRGVSVINRPSKCNHSPASRRRGTRYASRSLGHQPTEQVQSRVPRCAWGQTLGVSVINRPSKCNHTMTMYSRFGMLWQSRSSTDRTSAITFVCDEQLLRQCVSVINRPSKCNHAPAAVNVRVLASSLGHQPAEQVQSQSRATAAPTDPRVSVINRPSKCNHTRRRA